MCCEAFCRGLCSILSSSAILVLDIVDAAVGAALLFSPLLWSSYVTAAPATVALPSYGACLALLSAVSLFGVGFRSNSGLLAAAVLAALCFVTEFTGGLIIASDPDFAAKLGLEIPTGWALLLVAASFRHAVRGASNGALGRARDAFDALRARAMLDLPMPRSLQGLFAGFVPRLAKRPLQTTLIWALFEDLDKRLRTL